MKKISRRHKFRIYKNIVKKINALKRCICKISSSWFFTFINTIIQFVLTVQTVGSSLYKKQKTTTVKSSFFGLLEGITLTGAVVIGVGGVIVHSVYALYTGEPTLWDIVTMNTGPIFTQPAQPTAAQPTAAIPAPEPAPVPVTETLSVWTRFKNWWMGMHPNTVKKNKQEKLQELDDALQSSIDDFFKKEKENAEIRENVKNYVDWYVSTMLIENPDIKENPSKLVDPENLEFAYVLAVLLVKAEENQYSTLPEQEAFLLKIQKEWKEIEKKNAMNNKIKSV